MIRHRAYRPHLRRGHPAGPDPHRPACFGEVLGLGQPAPRPGMPPASLTTTGFTRWTCGWRTGRPFWKTPRRRNISPVPRSSTGRNFTKWACGPRGQLPPADGGVRPVPVQPEAGIRPLCGRRELPRDWTSSPWMPPSRTTATSRPTGLPHDGLHGGAGPSVQLCLGDGERRPLGAVPGHRGTGGGLLPGGTSARITERSISRTTTP